MGTGNQRIEIVSITWDSAIISFSFNKPYKVKAECIKPEKKLLAGSEEKNSIGRIYIEELKPDTQYTIRITGGKRKKEIYFTTLPKPKGKLMSSFAVVADPHISLKKENRKGRLFIESRSILQEIIEEINIMKLDFLLLTGDITNKGLSEEYASVENIIHGLDCPLFAVPGDHDVCVREKAGWTKTFGQCSWARDIRGYRITGLDTSSGNLGTRGRALIEKCFEAKSTFPLLVAHHQLIPDSYITSCKSKIIKDADKSKDLLMEAGQEPVLIYVGHQNVPSIIRKGRALQVNVSQPLQYPCGYLLVRRYANGFYHTFMPIRSEVLNEYSRAESNRAAEQFNEPQWKDTYRRGRDVYQSNFLFKL